MFEQQPFFPFTPKSSLALYYQCKKCKTPLLSINKPLNTCEFCGNHDLERIEEHDFYSILKTMVSDDGWKEVINLKREIDNELVDLTTIKPQTSVRARIN